jgi:hypothetical protein
MYDVAAVLGVSNNRILVLGGERTGSAKLAAGITRVTLKNLKLRTASRGDTVS